MMKPFYFPHMTAIFERILWRARSKRYTRYRKPIVPVRLAYANIARQSIAIFVRPADPSLAMYLSLTFSLSLSLSLSLASYDCSAGNKTEFLASQNLTEEEFQEHPTINWDAILWVSRPLELWVFQVILAIVSLTEALLLAYLGYKVRHLASSLRDFASAGGFSRSDVALLHFGEFSDLCGCCSCLSLSRGQLLPWVELPYVT